MMPTKTPLYFLQSTCFFLFVWLTGCTSAQAPPVTDPPTQSHLTGKFIWHDLLTSDVNTSKKFYQALLGWTFKQSDQYTLIYNHDIPIGGMVQIDNNNKNQAARWMASLSVEDVQQSAMATKTLGGAIHEGPAKIKNRGRYALISDPNGAELVLLNSDSGDPEDLPPTAGTWLWDELWAQDIQKALDFYQQLAGYELTPINSHYIVAKKHDTWRAGIRPVLIDSIKSRWIPVIQVDDPNALAERLETLGGQNLLETHPPDSDTDTVLAADPAGALFMLQSWTDPALSQEE